MSRRWEARPRWRLTRGKEIALGPGKADLLGAIDRRGSISAAARALDMSYRRAWLLVETMNRCFGRPLVVTTRWRGTVGGRPGSRCVDSCRSWAGPRMDRPPRHTGRESAPRADESNPHASTLSHDGVRGARASNPRNGLYGAQLLRDGFGKDRHSGARDPGLRAR